MTIERYIDTERRAFLKAAGISLALPVLPSLGQGTKPDAAENAEVAKRRMVCIGNMLGFYPGAFWPRPTETPAFEGGYASTAAFTMGRTTASLAPLRDKLTVFSGLDHDLKGGHFSIHAFLSGVRQVDAKSMPMANITVDQYAAEFIPGQTRFPTLTIGSETGIHDGCQLSWTRSGTRVPPLPGPQQVFETLFVGRKQTDKAAARERFATQGSILDLVTGRAGDLKRQLNSQDRDKLDEYMTAVRDVESRIALRQAWVDVPKPAAPIPKPANRNMVEDLPLLYDLIVLALQTDSTRIATLEIGGDFNPADLGIKGGYHAFSHHGQRKESIEALVALETYQIEQFARFVRKLDAATDATGRPLLETTSVLFGSGMGNANSHTNSDLPLILAGGSYPHGRLITYDRKAPGQPPLTNLFVSMLQEFGAEVDAFATSTGTLRGLVG